MQARASSKKRKNRFLTPELRILVWLFKFLLFLGVLAAAYVALVSYSSRAYCVVLPNGYMIGHVAVLRFEPNFQVDMLLRDPSGRELLRSDAWIELERIPEKPGQLKIKLAQGALEMPGEEIMLAFRDQHDAEQNGRTWGEPNANNPDDVSITSTDLYTLYYRLKKSRKFEMANCGTPWFDPGD